MHKLRKEYNDMRKDQKKYLSEPKINPIMSQNQVKEVRAQLQEEIEEEMEVESKKRELARVLKGRGYNMASKNLSWKNKYGNDDLGFIKINNPAEFLWNKPEYASQLTKE